MLLCLELLTDHLSLSSAAGASIGVLGQHAQSLRQLLFRLLDATVSDDLKEVRQPFDVLLGCLSHSRVRCKTAKIQLFWMMGYL